MTANSCIETLIHTYEKTGYFIADIDDPAAYQNIQEIVTRELCSASGVNCNDLTFLHKILNTPTLNDVRYKAYSAINSDASFCEHYFSVFRRYIETLVGTELAAQAKCNLSIQFPGDENSRLGLHTDTVSGQSEYEIVCWLPLTSTEDTNSIFIFDLKSSQEMLSLLPVYHLRGMDTLFDDWHKKCAFLKLNPGQCLVFSSMLMHGNVINKTQTTRVSLNMRFKGLFTPYSELPHSEKKLGTFYKPFRILPTTRMALNYSEPDDQF